jgi:hypothetical protein
MTETDFKQKFLDRARITVERRRADERARAFEACMREWDRYFLLQDTRRRADEWVAAAESALAARGARP